MIEYILGVPGSGKTYRAVHILYNTFKVDGKKRHFKNTHFFTNINEFKFDSFQDKGFKLVFDDLYRDLSDLYLLSQSGATDSELSDLAKERNLYDCLFIIDECHNYFAKDDSVLVWWLTYHRHLHHNILLLTQDLGLVKAKYKTLTENFYKAVPSSRRLSLFKPKFQYKHFATSRMSKTDYAGTINLDFNKDIYDLYHSGANTQAKNIVIKYIIVAFIFVVILIFLFIAIKSWWSSKYTTPDEKNATVSSSSSPAGSLHSNAGSFSPSNRREVITIYCDSVECSNGMSFQDLVRYRVISSELMPNLSSVRRYRCEELP